MDPYSSGVDDYIPRKRSPWVLVGRDMVVHDVFLVTRDNQVNR